MRIAEQQAEGRELNFFLGSFGPNCAINLSESLLGKLSIGSFPLATQKEMTPRMIYYLKGACYTEIPWKIFPSIKPAHYSSNIVQLRLKTKHGKGCCERFVTPFHSISLYICQDDKLKSVRCCRRKICVTNCCRPLGNYNALFLQYFGDAHFLRLLFLISF